MSKSVPILIAISRDNVIVCDADMYKAFGDLRFGNNNYCFTDLMFLFRLDKDQRHEDDVETLRTMLADALDSLREQAVEYMSSDQKLRNYLQLLPGMRVTKEDITIRRVCNNDGGVLLP